MREEDVTLALAAHLRRAGWRILTTHSPGSQGGVYVLRSPRPTPPTKGAVVLDLVAQQGNVYLLVESKGRYSRSDAAKVVGATRDPAYRESLADRFGIVWRQKPLLVPAVALPNNAHVPANVPEGAVVIAVESKGARITAGKPERALPGVRQAKAGA